MHILVAAFLAVACTFLGSGAHAESGDPDEPRLTSSAFADGGGIPARYTCDGDNVSPPLAWSNLPEGTRSLALVLDDPDAPDPKAPKITWIHWVVYNIPPEGAGLVPKPSARRGGGSQQLEANGLRRTVSSHRAAPLLPQALRPRRRASRPRQTDPGRPVEGHGRPRAGPLRSRGHLPALTGRGLRPVAAFSRAPRPRGAVAASAPPRARGRARLRRTRAARRRSPARSPRSIPTAPACAGRRASNRA